MADKPETKLSEWIINCPRLTSREEIAEKVVRLEVNAENANLLIEHYVGQDKIIEELQRKAESFESETLGPFGSRKLIALFVLQDELRDLLPELGICSGLGLAIGIIRSALVRVGELDSWGEELEQENQRLRPLAEQRVLSLEVQYDQSDDGSHYQMWQDAKQALEGGDDVK